MASTINAQVSPVTGVIVTPDGTGVLALQTGGTTAVTIGTNQVVTLAQPLPAASGGTGLSSPGTNGNVLTSNGSAWTSAAGYTNANVLTLFSASDSAPVYACRAWVNFNGSGGGIRSSGNVTSIAVNGTGRYTVNMTTALPDANYSRVITASGLSSDNNGICSNTDVVGASSVTASTTAFGILLTISGQSGFRDSPFVSAAVFR